MKQRLLTLTLCSILLTGCGTPEQGPTYIPTNKTDFSKYDLGNVEQIQSSDPTFKSKLRDFINTNNSVQLTSFDCTGDNRVRLLKSIFPADFGTTQALVLASQNYEGNITLTFASKLKSVTIKAQQYYNLTPGYSGDTHIYPTYDSQKWDEETSEYIPDEPTLKINEQIMTSIVNITYSYDDEDYPIPNVPGIFEQKFDINSTTLSITAFESQRIRIYEISYEFEA